MSVRRRNRHRGLIRNADGVVIARRDEHPLAHLFEAVPSYDPATQNALPPMHMPPEFRQLLAIHIFDNLRCAPPADDAVYRLVKNKVADAPLGLAGALWVPHSVPDEVFEPEPVEDDGVDIDGLSDAQLTVLQAKIDQRRIDDAHRAATDAQITDTSPEWVRYRERRLQRIADAVAEQGADE